MPAAVASRARAPGSSAPPPAKKTKTSLPHPAAPAASRKRGLGALLHTSPGKRPPVAANINGVQSRPRHRVHDATAVVSGGHAGHGDVAMPDAPQDVIEISSGDDLSSDSSGSEDEGGEDANAGAEEEASIPATNGRVEDNHDPLRDGSAEPEEPSFGERLRAEEPEPETALAPHTVDVDAALVGPNAELRAQDMGQPLAAPSATSLATVLAQALRTNDQELLDSCLRVNHVDTVYATIERLPSPLVGTLLQKVAERLHKRPGRPGMLMVWVQWSLSAHGGYLAAQPQLVKQLVTLNKVLRERASGLQPLLSLKGRLDMLHTQLELRRRNQRKAAHDDMDEAVIYVEGEEEPSSDDDEGDSGHGGRSTVQASRKRLQHDSADDGESSVDEMPTTMEMNEDSQEGSEDSDDLIDDEAEETEDDTGDDMSEPMSDDLGEDDLSESEEESRPAKRSTAGRSGLSRRY